MLLEKTHLYIKSGTGQPVIVFLHGWGLSKEIWMNIFPEIASSHTVYAIDLPAFGNNHKNYKNITHDDYVQYVYEFLQKQNISSCILVGHSFGGRVATLFTLQYPEKVKKLILYSASVPVEQKQINYLNLLVSELVLLFSVLTRTIKYKKFSIKDYSHLQSIHKTIRSVNPFKNKLTLIRQPVLVIAGRFDFASSLNKQKSLYKQFGNTKLVIFNCSTHIAHIEERKKFIKTLLAFVRT